MLPQLSSERSTILVSALALAGFLLVTGIAPDWATPKTPRGFAKGKSIPVNITLVTADSTDLACAGEVEAAGARCGFDSQGRPWAGATEGKKVLAPYMTLDNVLFLIPDLWEEPAIARQLEKDPPRGARRENLKRFTAKCELKLEEKAENFYVRWLPSAEWSPRPEAWVGSISGCSID